MKYQEEKRLFFRERIHYLNIVLFLGFNHLFLKDYKIDELIIVNILYHLKHIILNFKILEIHILFG